MYQPDPPAAIHTMQHPCHLHKPQLRVKKELARVQPRICRWGYAGRETTTGWSMTDDVAW
jgi:hypothetical protein